MHLLEPAKWLERILDQEGVPFRLQAVGCHNERNHDIVYTTSAIVNRIHAQLIITDHKTLSRALGKKVRSAKAAQFTLSEKRGHASISVWASDFRNLNNYLELGQHLDALGQRISGSGIVMGEIDGRQYLSLPWSMNEFPLHWSRWSMYLTRTRQSDSLFCEAVPRIDDRLVREAVFEALVRGYEAIKAPMVRMSPRISGPGFISVRIDADGHSLRSTERVSALAESLGIPFSWFIDTWSWKNEGAAVKKLSFSNEVGLHSYFHATSVWKKSNVRNMQKGFEFLNDAGVPKNGFVSPYGHSNSGLSAAISSEKILYSSEFAFSCDVIASKLRVGEMGTPLQIPTIPISLGVWTGAADYWEVLREEIETRLRCSGFAVFYDHPLDRLEHEVHRLR